MITNGFESRWGHQYFRKSGLRLEGQLSAVGFPLLASRQPGFDSAPIPGRSYGIAAMER